MIRDRIEHDHDPSNPGTYILRASMYHGRPRAEGFALFLDAHNLEAITPPELQFRILTPDPFAIRQGTLIDYRISLHGVPMTWRTLISRWEVPDVFVDEQLKGPYAQWIHTPTFRTARVRERLPERTVSQP